MKKLMVEVHRELQVIEGQRAYIELEVDDDTTEDEIENQALQEALENNCLDWEDVKNSYQVNDVLSYSIESTTVIGE